MAELGKILIADDEETFLYSTADLLRLRGYECVCAANATEAADFIKKYNFDLLISDIRMPGNPELEFIQSIPKISQSLPVILVTGYPSLKTAIMSIKLPVLGYLVKPIDLEELLDLVRSAFEYSLIKAAAQKAQNRLKDWNNELARFNKEYNSDSKVVAPVTVEEYLGVSLSNINMCLRDITFITEAVSRHYPLQDACKLLNCPRERALTGVIEESIEILDKSKRDFKSKELGDIRKKLETILGDETKE
jgi:YesN/AraC family two-component response regulator